MKLRALCHLAAAAIVAAGLTVGSQAKAIGLLILEGSDAQTFHRLDPYSTDFLNGMASFSTAPTLPILAVDTSTTAVGTPTVGITYAAVIPSLATLLSDYSGLYIMSPSGCCSENDAAITGHSADVRAFLEAGRSVSIENYQGGSAFDEVIGNTGSGAGTANSHVAGYGGGVSGLGSCFDGNIVAAGGAAFGLGPVGSPVPNLGCFGHQAYDHSFFDSLGLTTYIVTTPPGSGFHDFNVVISNGGGSGCGLACATVPEPASLSLLGSGMAAMGILPGFGLLRRRRRNGKGDQT